MSTTDFGWRLHGRVTTVLADHSFDLQRAGEEVVRDGAFLRRYGRHLGPLESCLQCGACTATCDLSGSDGMFPRRQVTLVRLGLAAQAAQTADIWRCYACTDCTARCPSGVRPSAVMGALRQAAIERAAWPRPVGRVVNDPRLWWAPYAAVAAFLALLVAASGSFQAGLGPVNYAGMLPAPVLIPVFSVLTLMALVAVGVGVARAAPAWNLSSAPEARRQVWRAFLKALPEIADQRRMSQCAEDRLKPWAHRAIVVAFAGLVVVSATTVFVLAAGRTYPLPMGNPVKILGNVFAALLIGGASYFLVVRVEKARRGEGGDLFDWAMPANVWLAGVTGVATEVVRVAGARDAAYPVFFVHLTVILVLMLTLPYSKLAHVAYRVTAVTAREHQALALAAEQAAGAAGPAGQGRDNRDAAPPAPPSPEQLLAMGQRELSRYPDDVVIDAYYHLRDQSEPRGGGRYYPNIKRLFLSPLEREKDRREVAARAARPAETEWQSWYQEAAGQPCTWWLENHIGARHALTTCLNCGMCTSVCPAAEHFEEYDPRCIVATALSGDEESLVSLLKSDIIWYCAQCGSCNSRCPHSNDIMGLVGSLRTLAQLKGYHLESVRGRQQYFARHLWGGNLWNRAMSMYFRDVPAADHPDFGPRYAEWQAHAEEQFMLVGGQPDMDGAFAGRKVAPETLEELRNCIAAGGALVLWDKIERHAVADAARLGVDLDEYFDKVRREG